MDGQWQGQAVSPDSAHIKAKAKAILGAGQGAVLLRTGTRTLKAPGLTLGFSLSPRASSSTNSNLSPTCICCPGCRVTGCEDTVAWRNSPVKETGRNQCDLGQIA